MSTSSSPLRSVGGLDLPADSAEGVVALLETAAGPATDIELHGEAAAVALFLVHRGEVPAPRRRLSLRSIRIAVATVVASVGLGGGLAAADVLPAPAQRWVSRALNAVGIDVPSPDQPTSSPAS